MLTAQWIGKALGELGANGYRAEAADEQDPGEII